MAQMWFRPGRDGRRGAVAIMIAVMMAALIGFVSLGTEIVLLLATSRHMQSAADAAALAAITARLSGHPADYRQEAFAITASAGFANNVDGAKVVVNSPPLTGNYTKPTDDAVEVLITQPQTLPLASVIYKKPFVLHARAVARGSGGSGSCVLTLDTAESGSFSMNGSAVASFVNCDLSVNSTSPQAVSLVGGAVVNAGNLYDAGGYSLSGGSAINATITTAAPATADPYASQVMPNAAGTCIADPNVKGTKSIPPGTYCAIGVGTSSGNLTLTPGGTYFIKGGGAGLSVGANATLKGTGVTIVLTGTPSTGYATVNISAGSTVTLTAPASGATAGVVGMVFFQDRNAPASGTNTVGGGTSLNITGALYFPNQTLSFSGGSTSTVTCIELVARKVTLTGNAALKVDCSGTGVLPISGGGNATLME